MASQLEYILMSSAAYDERRLLSEPEGPETEHVANLELVLAQLGWRQLGANDGFAGGGVDDATITHSSGMQADVWENAQGEIVIAFRGTEVARGDENPLAWGWLPLAGAIGQANNDFRRDDANLDRQTLASWVLESHANFVFDQARAACETASLGFA